ncbi:MAG: hypothetical protein JRH07_02395, partial [Deltaproteobacteria bacterium]|nr:hypothetical protein [Deltaproteobacteria bacterium]
MDRKWKVRSSDPDFQQDLAGGFLLSPLAARVIFNRGIRTVEEAERFIRPSLSHL